MKNTLVIGSRGSKLALTQAQMIKTELERIDPAAAIRVEIIKTSGDASADPLSVIGGKGVFTKELEEALLDGRIDIAVHSLKDLPTIIPEQLVIAAICKRDDPRDALVLNRKLLNRGRSPTPGSPPGQPGWGGTVRKGVIAMEQNPHRVNASIQELPKGANVGTSSPRRLAQLKHLRGDLVIKELRGNVDTRLRKLDEGQYDALVLACAGLRRLGLESRISAPIPANEMLPAVGQGALGIETRADDSETREAVAKLDHKFTRLACEAERALLRSLGGGCQLPIAAYAVVREKRIRLDGLVADTHGKRIVRDRISGTLDEAEDLGRRLGEQLLSRGARELLGAL